VEELIATYEAYTSRLRAQMFRLPKGAYRVDIEWLYQADDAGGVVHGVFWSRLRGFTSYTDNKVRAAELAQDNLRGADLAEP